jgi:hypothetical protein
MRQRLDQRLEGARFPLEPPELRLELGDPEPVAGDVAEADDAVAAARAADRLDASAGDGRERRAVSLALSAQAGGPSAAAGAPVPRGSRPATRGRSPSP